MTWENESYKLHGYNYNNLMHSELCQGIRKPYFCQNWLSRSNSPQKLMEYHSSDEQKPPCGQIDPALEG